MQTNVRSLDRILLQKLNAGCVSTHKDCDNRHSGLVFDSRVDLLQRHPEPLHVHAAAGDHTLNIGQQLPGYHFVLPVEREEVE